MEGLRERGYVGGQNLVIECRYTEQREARAHALAKELASLQVDLLVAQSTGNVHAAKQATSTIPIVMVGVINPAARGLVASLARPGANVTGPSSDAGVALGGKYLQLLHEAVPKASRVAVLNYQSGTPIAPGYDQDTATAARALNVTLQQYGVRAPEELDDVFAAMKRARAEALVVMPHSFMWQHAKRIVDLATQNRLPAMYPGRAHVEAGGLLAYDLDESATYGRVGYYVDQILRGAKPGDLPVEQPTKFELVVNLKTAGSLGLTLPTSLLHRADQVIR